MRMFLLLFISGFLLFDLVNFLLLIVFLLLLWLNSYLQTLGLLPETFWYHLKIFVKEEQLILLNDESDAMN